ncbi:alpha/beta hydrolase [Flavobacteriaceae bacterium S0825]|uniref:alpha/beta hydrolase n=1 Tax=Gaetbulibacter sp. S0825 TaxID=2720084 RepID=UPI00143150AC|nr:alpha/beta hydrolase [Gaetbulibacter sp. S0825]MCK0109316.1 alpha/beta hydrolase [Flavobacteriaceae bacterium S0825]NIX64950.1 alpha/beta hydrolase [Gaetbulibacter sp. S0825]
MSQDLIHVYFMPGMAANPSIFEHIQLPKEEYRVHLLEWFVPNLNETLEEYAKRMAEKIEYDNVILLGVSFGGVLVQEMSKFLNLKKLIIVSSVKNKHELPKRMKLAKITKAYKLLPTQFVSNFESFAKYTFGETIKKRVNLYKKYLSVNDKRYLDWAIHNMICWEQDEVISNIIHIHGDKDPVFPIKNISDSIIVKGGTHIMIINKYKWFNENLPKLILS